MASVGKQPETGPPKPPGLGRLLFADVRGEELGGSFARDLKALYGFYLDDEARAQLQSLGRVRRAMKIVPWILRSMLLKLAPGRRMMLLTAVVMFVLGRTNLWMLGLTSASISLRPWGFIFLLVVLMLELKDKLLARDDIEVARQVQLALLPRVHPQPAGWTIWSHTRPANDVGGDLIDAVPLGAGPVLVVLGDVAGKGLGAALLMAKLQATLRTLAPRCQTLGALGSEANAILHRDGLENRFATLFGARLDPGSPRVRYLNAGHDPAFVVGAAGLRELAASSLPLGMFDGGDYSEAEVTLEPGDLLVIYSDGLVEARGPGDEEFGAGRLRDLLRGRHGADPPEIGPRLIGAVEGFLAGGSLHDDLSLVVVAWRGPA